jgi:ubiquitin-conjugating enzyme E2 S
MSNLTLSSNFGSVSASSYNSSPGPQVIKILWRQQKALIDKHPDGVLILINEEDPLDINAIIEGPKETPYEGGQFKVKIIVSESFPQTAPKGFFLTKIFHPNVSEKGEICVNTLKKDWNPKNWSLYNVLEV